MTKDTKNYKILVVERNAGDFILIEDYLLEYILTPVVLRSGTFGEVKSLLTAPGSRLKFDVILLDLSLPDKDGQELIEEVLKLCDCCPVIVLTGYEDVSFSIKSLSLGIADYLLKDGLTPAALYKSIIYSIERYKSRMQLMESEKKFADLFDLGPVPKWVYDPETLKFIKVNKAAIASYGYSEEEFLKMTILDIRPPEDMKRIKTLSDKLSISEVAFNSRARHYTKWKELLEVEVYSSPITFQGKTLRSVLAIDATEKLNYERKLVRAIIKTQEDERYEIGSELHDNVCQLLATSQLSLGMLRPSISVDDIKWYDRCRDYIVQASEEIRNLSHRLAPAFFEDTPLEDTFSILLQSCNADKKYDIDLYFDEQLKNKNLSRETKINMYRILQEQLRNIVQYAKASEIKVEVLVNKGELEMTISDNGVGFDVTKVKKGIGIANMTRRTELFSGLFEINSSPGHGSEVHVVIPIKPINTEPSA